MILTRKERRTKREAEKALVWLKSLHPDGEGELHCSTDPETGRAMIGVDFKIPDLTYRQGMDLEKTLLFVETSDGRTDYRRDLPFDYDRDFTIVLHGQLPDPAMVERERLRKERFDAAFTPEEQATISRYIAFSFNDCALTYRNLTKKPE